MAIYVYRNSAGQAYAYCDTANGPCPDAAPPSTRGLPTIVDSKAIAGGLLPVIGGGGDVKPTAPAPGPAGPYNNPCTATCDGYYTTFSGGCFDPLFPIVQRLGTDPSTPGPMAAPANPGGDAVMWCGRLYEFGDPSPYTFCGSYEQYVGDWNGTGDMHGIGIVAGWVGLPIALYKDKGCGLSTPPPDFPTTPDAPCNFCQGQTTGGVCPSCCASKIDLNIQPLTDAISELGSVIAKAIGDSCTLADKCIDQITDKVLAKLKAGGKTCEQCCQEIAEGVAHSAADALICAECECKECMAECTLAGGDPEGKCCTGCGQEPCCCRDLECVPCGEEPSSQTYIAWCNSQTGETTAALSTAEAFGPPWIVAGEANNLPDALAKAEQFCQYRGSPGGPLIIPPFVPPNVNEATECDISTFGGSQARSIYLAGYREVLGNAFELNLTASTVQAIQSGLQQVTGASALGPVLQSLALSPMVIAGQYGDILAQIAACPDSDGAAGVKALAATSYIAGLANFPLEQFAAPLYYAIHAECRNRHLDPDKAIASWLAGSTNDDDLDAYWAIAGLCQSDLLKYKQAAKSKPIPAQLVMLFNRGMISHDDFTNGMRQLGYVDQVYIDQTLALGQQLPPYSDIVRMMVRDAADETIPSWKQADVEFAQKYTGQLKQWAKGQGIPDEVFKLIWRSHYSIPSPGQLFEMLHRLRNDPAYGAPGELLERIKQALAQQDIAPDWRDPLIAISYNPLTRVDTRRAYEIGSINDDQVLQSYRNQGYDDENAAILLRFTQKLKARAIRSNPAIRLWLRFAIDGQQVRDRLSQDGFTDAQIDKGLSDASTNFAQSTLAGQLLDGEIDATEFIQTLQQQGVRPVDADRIAELLGSKVKWHPVIDEYTAGITTRDNARTQMVNAGMSVGRAEKLLTRVDGRLRISQAVTCSQAAKRKYVTGGINKADAVSLLVTSGLTEERASQLVGWWACELEAKGKQPSVSILCRWLAEGSIAPIDYVKRVQNLGYSSDDANNMLVDCIGRINSQRAKQALAQAKQEQQQMQRDARQAAQTAAALEAEAAKMAKARSERAKAVNRRMKQMAHIAEVIHTKGNLDWVPATMAGSDSVTYARQTYGFDIDQGIQVVTQAVTGWDGSTLDNLLSGVDALSASLISNLSAESEVTASDPV